MLTGPSDIAGQAGTQDGQLDALLEAGTYKLRAFAAEGATGEVTLAVAPFKDAAPPRTLDLLHPLDTDLGNLQQLELANATPGRGVRVRPIDAPQSNDEPSNDSGNDQTDTQSDMAGQDAARDQPAATADPADPEGPKATVEASLALPDDRPEIEPNQPRRNGVVRQAASEVVR